MTPLTWARIPSASKVVVSEVSKQKEHLLQFDHKNWDKENSFQEVHYFYLDG